MTTNNEELLALADKCEMDGASASLDDAIFVAVGCAVGDPAPYTTSIDAAVTLVPSACCWQVQMDICYEPTALVYGHDIHHDCNGGSPALALCAAALRARASLQSRKVAVERASPHTRITE